MSAQYKTFKIKDLFHVNSGDFHATKELDPGDVPLISCGDYNNGLVGYYAIPANKQYSKALTVAYNGRPLTTKYHPYKFGSKDDVAVLVPKVPMTQAVLLYVAALLKRMIWRYSYGRKCFKEKLQDVKIVLPVRKQDGESVIDSRIPGKLLNEARQLLVDGAKESFEALTPDD